MKKILNKINNWLITTDLENKFFESNIRWQLHSLINYILYPDLRKHNLREILKLNKYNIIILKIIVLSFMCTFLIARLFDYAEIKVLNYSIDRMGVKIHNLILDNKLKSDRIVYLSKDVRSREYLEYKVIKDSKISEGNLENLRCIPDSIFILMVDESDKYNIPYMIFFRIMEKESCFKFVKNDSSSALGYMQVIKSTFNTYYNKLNLKGGHTPGNNIRVAALLIGTTYDKWIKIFNSDEKAWRYTLGEYNCGSSAMIKDGKYSIPEEANPGINHVMKYYK